MRDTLETRSQYGMGGTLMIDTTFVLFFLAVELGQTLQLFSIDGFLMGVTTMMVLVLPYFLRDEDERPAFGGWLIGRGSIALFGLLLGIGFHQSLGVVLPESMRFMPMTLLVVSAMVSCYIQFYGLMKLRPAK